MVGLEAVCHEDTAHVQAQPRAPGDCLCRTGQRDKSAIWILGLLPELSEPKQGEKSQDLHTVPFQTFLYPEPLWEVLGNLA